ncbi:MAG: hypothetical protein HUJ66_04460, partial [Oscillospiraceae bacterium]|nr:hypothetical protein [Oscillospiraceae bacterium]
VSPGNDEYWNCLTCGELFADADCTQIFIGFSAPDRSNHTDIVTDPAVAASCTVEGLTEGSHCEACGAVITAQTNLGLESHAWEWVTDKEPTCVDSGEKHEKCLNCEATQSNGTVIDATGEHIDGDDDGLCDTCGEDLNPEPDFCSTPNNPLCILAAACNGQTSIAAKLILAAHTLYHAVAQLVK